MASRLLQLPFIYLWSFPVLPDKVWVCSSEELWVDQRPTTFRPRGQAGNSVNSGLLRDLSPLGRKLEEQKRAISGWYQLLLKEGTAGAGLGRSPRLTSQHWALEGRVSTCLFSSGLF